MQVSDEVSKTIVDLADLCSSQQKFIEKTSQNAGVTQKTAWAISNTIQTLTMDCGPPGTWPLFAVPALTLVPPKGRLPEPDALKQTYEFASSANIFAERQFCGSILAGQGSESDEFADVGFWCGEIDESNNETSILSSLSLGSWVEKGNIIRLDNAPLSTLRTSEIWDLFEGLGGLVEFRVERPDSGGRVMHVVAGKGVDGWCGMIGIGVWS
ncbi:hypothetical protein RhiJN_28259 [Ceratobasidium sp. AG-Ba]|nr:hypothetical protein RhiJN_28259 [Ceratobasidium sp. AG-Ba]